MAKKQIISFSLGEDVLEIIDKVKEEKKLNSRSQAVERIVLGHDTNTENIKNLVSQMISKMIIENGINFNNKPKTPVVSEKVMDEITQATLESMDDIFDNMPKE